jgi:hypothetical protein
MTDSDSDSDSDSTTGDRRGLLTDREREILLSDGAEVSDNYHRVVRARVKKKIKRVTDDIEALQQADLYDTLLDAVLSEEDSQPSGTTRTVDEGLPQSGLKEDVVPDE